jgi:hypothetical protein
LVRKTPGSSFQYGLSTEQDGRCRSWLDSWDQCALAPHPGQDRPLRPPITINKIEDTPLLLAPERRSSTGIETQITSIPPYLPNVEANQVVPPPTRQKNKKKKKHRRHAACKPSLALSPSIFTIQPGLFGLTIKGRCDYWSKPKAPRQFLPA